MDLITKLIKFDLTKSEITFKVMLTNEEIISQLLLLEGGSCKVVLKGIKHKETTKSSTRRRWFQVISHILKSSGVYITSDVLQAFHNDLKESLFDCKTFEVDGKTIVIVPSINSVPDEDVRKATEILIARYSQIGIDFKEIA